MGWNGLSLGLALLLLLTPLGALLWYANTAGLRERIADAEGQAAYRSARTRCAAITALGVVAFVLFAVLPDTPSSGGTWGIAVAAFHVAWWTTAAPLLNRGNREHHTVPGDLPAKSAAPVRVATLAPRRVSDAIPTWWWAVPIGGFVATTLWLATQTIAGASTPARAWTVLGPLAALSFLVGYGLWARYAAIGPQDLSGAVDPERYEQACDRFRRFIARGVFILMTLAMLPFLGVAVAVVVAQDDPASLGRIGGLIGGGMGALVGMCGGVFGAIATKRRMELANVRTGVAADMQQSMS